MGQFARIVKKSGAKEAENPTSGRERKRHDIPRRNMPLFNKMRPCQLENAENSPCVNSFSFLGGRK
jgi:hypothetical protein